MALENFKRSTKPTNHLLVVGINRYTHFPKLINASKDAVDFADLLVSKYQFEKRNLKMLLDEEATADNINMAFRELIERVPEGDNVIIFYSGHGVVDETIQESFWIPSEARDSKINDFISFSTILKFVKAIKSLHTVLFVDSCYSGAYLTRYRSSLSNRLESYPSRWLVASGRNEIVGDGMAGKNSPFTNSLLRILETRAEEGLIMSELAAQLTKSVAYNSVQTPIAQPLFDSGDQGGQFVFWPKNHVKNPNPDESNLENPSASRSLDLDIPKTKNQTADGITKNYPDLISTKLHSDHWSSEDFLGYESYAQTIEHIIKDKDSNPPLTIGIIAPWGQGKTTLMRYIWRRFRAEESVLKPKLETWKVKAQPNQIKTWVEGDENDWEEAQKKYSCVWFNPWKYQSSSQIWAGMADAIIKQLVSDLTPIKQEEFWLKLQWKRIDKAGIRRDLHRALLTKFIPNFVIFSVAILVAISAFFIEKIGDTYNYVGMLSSISAAFTAFHGIWAWRKATAETRAKQLENYLKSPDYSGEAGAFHHVNEDMERVFDLLVSEEKPALIFIDDLDRCIPQKVVDVIEAINLMMNARFRRKCYFIMGMDSEMVAASIDVAYGEMKGMIPGKEQTFGSVGWYFLDKFVQLPFLIPTLRLEDKERLIQGLFNNNLTLQKGDFDEPSPLKEEDVEKIKTQAKIISVETSVENIKKDRALLNENEKVIFDEAFLEKKFEDNKDTPDIVDKVTKYAKYLDPSPRSIKRFANLLRFHASHQQLREIKDLPNADKDTLAIWLTISLRWPKLVRWLQWHDERNFAIELIQSKTPSSSDNEPEYERFISKHPLEKAAQLDALIEEAKQKPTIEEAYEFWEELIPGNDVAHLNWFCDQELLKLLYEMHNKDTSMVMAFKCGIW